MKRILLPATGAIIATGLLAAGLAGAAQAAPTQATDPLAAKPADAASVANFWYAANGAAMKKAKEYQWDSNVTKTKLVSGGGYSPDGKPGLVLPTGAKKVTPGVVKNINLPLTVGKVFFQTSKGDLGFCTGTSIDAKYKNLVATAGHCVYDVASNGDVMRNWVFVPGYHEGKAPRGVYVGKTAYTHYDFDNFEDFDRDYAFVTVYNGFSLDSSKQVLKSEYEAWKGEKYTKDKEISKEEYEEGVKKYGENGPYQRKSADPKVETVAKPADAQQNLDKYLSADGFNGIKLTSAEVTESVYNAAPTGLDNNAKFERLSQKVAISQDEYKALQTAKGDGKFLGSLTTNAAGTAWFKQQFFVKKWVKTSVKEIYFVQYYFIVSAVDRGSLGSQVGGQGFAWNQKSGQPVFVFGFPAAPHADGNKPFTGVTMKYCYNKKPSGKIYTAAAYKVEEHIAIKCAMTAGSDGGAWLIKYSNAKRIGFVNGVTSLFGDQDQNGRVDAISTAYFDGETATVYNSAANKWSGSIVSKDGIVLR
ncbi:hypothetical protein [Streptosporangium sp. KLBMP 9127]|nr:hypothetical protein [Streptosporangium sp. KLBMP 9127]